MGLVRIRGIRPGSAVVEATPDTARSLVDSGLATYVEDAPAKEVTAGASKRRTTGSASRGTGRKPRSGGPSKSASGS